MHHVQCCEALSSVAADMVLPAINQIEPFATGRRVVPAIETVTQSCHMQILVVIGRVIWPAKRKISLGCGQVVHIDLGIAFEQGRFLNTPELVPFRLTRDVVDGMGATGGSCNRQMNPA